MSNVLTSLFSLLLATNQPAAASNLVEQSTGLSIAAIEAKDPVGQQLRQLMREDDDARAEIDKWIRDSQSFEEKGAGFPQATLNLRIKERLAEVQKKYEAFIEVHPDHAATRIAYGSFLSEIGEEAQGAEQWEKARELDPNNPAVWNNLANYYGHRSPVKKSFEYYAKAIELDPKEPVYVWNFATTVYLFRKDAMEFYGISETEVFDKALGLYRKALELDPENFILHSDYAQSFYGTKPPRYDEGLKAWEAAFEHARDDIEREGVLIHFARCKIHLGQLEDAEKHLGSITNKMYRDLKERLTRKLESSRNPSVQPSDK